jgi:hypothetical protein
VTKGVAGLFEKRNYILGFAQGVRTDRSDVPLWETPHPLTKQGQALNGSVLCILREATGLIETRRQTNALFKAINHRKLTALTLLRNDHMKTI